MPFAVVEGEPVTELPRDLYIPPDALQVFLEAFEGPLDLLLYLIRQAEPRHPRHPDRRDHAPVHEVHRGDGGPAARAGRRVPADGRDARRDQVAHAAAAAAGMDGQEEDDPRAELVRRLQEYERFKKAAEDIDRLTRMERDTLPASAELVERKVVKILPQVTLQEMLVAFKDVLSRAEMFAHHHVNRERLSVRQRMSDILSGLREAAFMNFTQLFRPEEGRMGVTVTFIAILELMREGLIEIVQSEAYGADPRAHRDGGAPSQAGRGRCGAMTRAKRTRRTKRRWRSRRSPTKTNRRTTRTLASVDDRRQHDERGRSSR